MFNKDRIFYKFTSKYREKEEIYKKYQKMPDEVTEGRTMKPLS